MSSYSTQLRTIIEQATQYQPTLSTQEKIEEGRKKLFDFDYPIFDPNYKKVFETNFIRHFYMREIGFEAEGLFKFQLESWLLLHMPYFNKLFESELIEFDPLENSSVDVTANKTNNKTQNDTRDKTKSTTLSQTANSQTDSTSDTTANNETDTTNTTNDDSFERKLESDTPDSRLTITSNDGEGVIEYASNIKEENENSTQNQTGNETSNATSNTTDSQTVDSTSNVTGNDDENDKLVSNINDVEDYIQHRGGKIGVQTYSKMLQEYRSSFLRIEKQMFEEMQQLFMLVY